LQFWYQKIVNILFLFGSKITRGDLRLFFKTYKKIARWHHH
jgi:hypothetical protein